ncbi:MAG: hypothetical protein ABJP93_00625 [Marinobacter sp.]|uniref:hypothetical protein n=1 Tax=Marinobacter sp. TaxID=50741 RepID=UPI003297FA4D
MSNMLRKALLGGAALAVMTTGAAADELSTLKAQLAALQSQVDTIQSAPAQAPAGSSMLRYERGLGGNTWGLDAVKDSANVHDGGGFTIAVTPTADLPAPVAEVTVYGYAAGHVAYDFDGNHGVANSFSTSTVGNDSGDHIALTHQQSRFGIKSKIDTAVGQIRTQLEFDAAIGTASENDNGFQGGAGSTRVRSRHAVGHWDMTPNWTLSVGQWWYTAALLPIGVSTVDFAGSLLTYSRTPQVRLSYSDGPLSWAVSIENPSFDTDTNMPNIAGYMQYDIAGGHQFIVTGEVADWDPVGNDELGWAIQAGVNFNLADVATLTAGVGYGEGLLTQKFVFEDGFSNVDSGGDPLEAIAFVVGLSFGLSETTTFNAMFSYAEALEDQPGAFQKDTIYKVHANVLWQPVKQMRMGWEVIWAQSEFENGGADEDGVRASFATWFFF